MYPKVRSPFVSWVLTVITGGAYLPYWAWRVSSEINSAENREVFRANLWRNLAVSLFSLALIGLVVAKNTQNPLFFLVVAVCLLAFVMHVQISIGNYIKTKDAQLGTGEHYSNAVSVILFWLVANTGVAYMQAGINRVIRHERARS